MNNKYIVTAIVLSVISITTPAVEIAFKETQVLLQGEDVQNFQLKDIDGDHRLDIIWLTSNGQVNMRLQDNQAMMNFNDLTDTTWKLIYDNRDFEQTVTFTALGGEIKTQSNYYYNIVKRDVTELNQLTFCTDFSYGLTGKQCEWKYEVTDVLPHVLKGIDKRTSETWTATQLIEVL